MSTIANTIALCNRVEAENAALRQEIYDLKEENGRINGVLLDLQEEIRQLVVRIRQACSKSGWRGNTPVCQKSQRACFPNFPAASP